jgi:hypothetical protein
MILTHLSGSLCFEEGPVKLLLEDIPEYDTGTDIVWFVNGEQYNGGADTTGVIINRRSYDIFELTASAPGAYVLKVSARPT